MQFNSQLLMWYFFYTTGNVGSVKPSFIYFYIQVLTQYAA